MRLGFVRHEQKGKSCNEALFCCTGGPCQQVSVGKGERQGGYGYDGCARSRLGPDLSSGGMEGTFMISKVYVCVCVCRWKMYVQ